MAIKKGLTLSALALAASVIGSNAVAETSAEVGISSTYLLRGLDIDSPQFWGSASYSTGGFSTSAWISSLGDSGYELDIVPSYRFAFSESFAVDVGAVVYKYEDVDLGDYTDLTLGVELGDAYVYYAHTVGDDYDGVDWDYLSLSYSYGSLSGVVGVDAWDDGMIDGSYTHLDLSWAFNDKLSFTVSKIVAKDGSYGDSIASSYSDDVKFLVSYALPIE